MAARRADDPLGPRLQPEGWRISFRAPKQFLRGESTDPSIVPFLGPPVLGVQPVLVFWQVAVPGSKTDAAISAEILREHGMDPGPVDELLEPPAGSGALGDRTATQAGRPDGPAMVRFMRYDDGSGYAVSVSVSDGTIDDELYHLYNSSCESIEYRVP